MRINTKIRYGLRTMIELACNDNPKGLLQKDIAVNQNISNKYLDVIIASLKAKGLIKTVRGKGSGYRLSLPPCEISMFDIYTAFEPVTVVECIDDDAYCDMKSNCSSTYFWNELKAEVEGVLKKKSLKDIACKEKPCKSLDAKTN